MFKIEFTEHTKNQLSWLYKAKTYVVYTCYGITNFIEKNRGLPGLILFEG